ncbi:phage tail tube protein [Streptosporangium sandarakinum]
MAADLLGDGNVKVTWCLNIANISAPTAAELNAGVDLQEYLTKDGLNIEPDQSAIDNTKLASTSETEDAGTTKFNIDLTYARKQVLAEDVAFNTLIPGQIGFLAVRRTMAHNIAWAAGQEAEVYPGRCGKRRRQPPVLNESQRVMVKLFNHEPADDEATVA